MKQLSNNYNLEERTAIFSEGLIKFCKSIKENNINRPVVNQLIRSGTSIGANYCEANNASSRKDFQNKIFICKKEAQETKYWLRMMSTCCVEKTEELRKLWKETQELTLIFQKIINSLRDKKIACLHTCGM
ncbi:MAG: four helix bundle protein [Patescibacteria group bacterium]